MPFTHPTPRYVKSLDGHSVRNSRRQGQGRPRNDDRWGHRDMGPPAGWAFVGVRLFAAGHEVRRFRAGVIPQVGRPPGARRNRTKTHQVYGLRRRGTPRAEDSVGDTNSAGQRTNLSSGSSGSSGLNRTRWVRRFHAGDRVLVRPVLGHVAVVVAHEYLPYRPHAPLWAIGSAPESAVGNFPAHKVGGHPKATGYLFDGERIVVTASVLFGCLVEWIAAVRHGFST